MTNVKCQFFKVFLIIFEFIFDTYLNFVSGNLKFVNCPGLYYK